jgi:hypothetical protein
MSFIADGLGVDSTAMASFVGMVFDAAAERHKHGIDDPQAPQVINNYHGPVVTLNTSDASRAQPKKRHHKEHRVNKDRYAARIPKLKTGEVSKFSSPFIFSFKFY